MAKKKIEDYAIHGGLATSFLIHRQFQQETGTEQPVLSDQMTSQELKQLEEAYHEKYLEWAIEVGIAVRIPKIQTNANLGLVLDPSKLPQA